MCAIKPMANLAGRACVELYIFLVFDSENLYLCRCCVEFIWGLLSKKENNRLPGYRAGGYRVSTLWS